MLLTDLPKRIIQYCKNNLALLGIAAVGLALRLWNLTAISLWHDEAFSALLIKYSWGEMFYRIGLDVHPPMYYVFLRVWHYVLGDSLFALRGLSVLFGMATVFAVYYLVKYAFNNKRAALIAALLVAVNPFQVQYVTEARMYTMGAFFAVAAALSLSVALRRQLKNPTQWKKFLGFYALFALCCAIQIYTHYYLLFTVAVLGAYAVLFCVYHYRLKLRRYIWVALSGLAIVASFLPWLKIFLFQLGQVGAGYWIPPMNLWSIPGTLWDLLLRFPNPTLTLMTLVFLLTLLIMLKVAWKYHEAEKWLILGGFIAPFAGSILFFILAKIQGTESSVYLVRYFIFCSAFYSILIALYLDRARVRQIANLILIVLVAVNLVAIWDYWNDLDVKQRRGMAAASEFLKANVEPQHKLYVGSSFEFFNYKYYNETSVTPRLFSGGSSVQDMPHFAGTAILTDDDLVKNFAESVQPGDIVWLIWTNGFGGTKPNTPLNWTQLDEEGFAEIRPYVGTWIYVTEFKVN
jgi:mannosyltransferase